MVYVGYGVSSLNNKLMNEVWLTYDILIGLLSRSVGMGLHLYIALVGLEECCVRFFVVMRWYENIYVEWIMVVMNISRYSNVVHDVCASLMIIKWDIM